jgi:hypothetical protein
MIIPSYRLIEVPLICPVDPGKAFRRQKKTDQREGHREDGMREFYQG